MNISNNYGAIVSPSNTAHIPTSVTNSNQTLPIRTLPITFYANMGSSVKDYYHETRRSNV